MRPEGACDYAAPHCSLRSLPVCGGGSLVAGNVGNLATTGRRRPLVSRNPSLPVIVPRDRPGGYFFLEKREFAFNFSRYYYREKSNVTFLPHIEVQPRRILDP